MVAWLAIIPAAISAIDAVSRYSQTSSGIESQSAWRSYNANMGLQTSFNNIISQNQIAQINAEAAISLGKTQAAAALGAAGYNESLLRATTQYNDLLFEEELQSLWEQADLDLKLLEQQRAQERGAIIAGQAASGTVIGEGSNEDVLIYQGTQAALDAFVVRHNADIKAAEIMNARARNLWEGEVQANKIRYEGRLSATVAMANANIGAMTGLAGQMISSQAAQKSAWSNYIAQSYGLNQEQTYSEQQAKNQLTQGLFTSAGQFASAYFAQKEPSLLIEDPNKNTQYDPSYRGYNQPR